VVQVQRFELHRDEDVSGVSGVGVVASGVVYPEETVAVFPDGHQLILPAGWCRIVWHTPAGHSSTVLWQSVADAEAVHGHDGATRIVWLD
jgi:hypothetical protein